MLAIADQTGGSNWLIFLKETLYPVGGGGPKNNKINFFHSKIDFFCT